MCIEFTDLNRVGQKDIYLFLWIDQFIDNMARYVMLRFLDTFLGYHQTSVEPTDAEKTIFITNQATFCNKVMTFSLKDTRATY